MTGFGTTAYLTLSKTTSSAQTAEKGEIKVRLIKMLGLAAVAAMAAMAFIGATSASANKNTQLCASHPSLLCTVSGNDVTVSGSGRLLASIDVICDSVEIQSTALGLAKPQLLHSLSMSFNSCETDSNDPCTVTVTELPLSDLLKVALDQGIVTALNGKTFVFCEGAIFGADLECEYDATGLEFSAGAQHMTANETPVNEIGSDFFCPNEPTLDALLVTTANRYILQ